MAELLYRTFIYWLMGALSSVPKNVLSILNTLEIMRIGNRRSYTFQLGKWYYGRNCLGLRGEEYSIKIMEQLSDLSRKKYAIFMHFLFVILTQYFSQYTIF